MDTRIISMLEDNQGCLTSDNLQRRCCDLIGMGDSNHANEQQNHYLIGDEAERRANSYSESYWITEINHAVAPSYELQMVK